MEINLVDSWSSPSVLHLKVVVTYKGSDWVSTKMLHVPFELLPKGALLAWLIEDLDKVRTPNGEPLF